MERLLIHSICWHNLSKYMSNTCKRNPRNFNWFELTKKSFFPTCLLVRWRKRPHKNSKNGDKNLRKYERKCLPFLSGTLIVRLYLAIVNKYYFWHCNSVINHQIIQVHIATSLNRRWQFRAKKKMFSSALKIEKFTSSLLYTGLLLSKSIE